MFYVSILSELSTLRYGFLVLIISVIVVFNYIIIIILYSFIDIVIFVKRYLYWLFSIILALLLGMKCPCSDLGVVLGLYMGSMVLVKGDVLWLVILCCPLVGIFALIWWGGPVVFLVFGLCLQSIITIFIFVFYCVVGSVCIYWMGVLFCVWVITTIPLLCCWFIYHFWYY